MGILFSSANPSIVEEVNEKRGDWTLYQALRQDSSSSEETEEQYSDPVSRHLRKRSFSAEEIDEKHDLASSDPLQESNSSSGNITKQHHNLAPSHSLLSDFRPRKENQITFNELSQGQNDGHVRFVPRDKPIPRQQQSHQTRSRRYTEPTIDRSPPQVGPANHGCWFKNANEEDSREVTGFMRAMDGEGGVYRL